MSCRASLLIKDASVQGGCQFLLQYGSHHLHENNCAESSRSEFKFNLNVSATQYVAFPWFHNTWSSSWTWLSHSHDADGTVNSCSFGQEMNRNWPVSHWQVTAHIFGQILEPVGESSNSLLLPSSSHRKTGILLILLISAGWARPPVVRLTNDLHTHIYTNQCLQEICCAN